MADTTVQEKNITFPTDAKLYRKIIYKCKKLASEQNIELRQTYTYTFKRLGIDQRFRNHPKNKKKAYKADHKVKTIAGRFVRELERKLEGDNSYFTDLALFKQVFLQTR